LFARNINKLSESIAEGSTVIEGNALNYNSLKNAIAGHHIVYVNLEVDYAITRKGEPEKWHSSFRKKHCSIHCCYH